MSALLFDQKPAPWPWLFLVLLPVGVGVHVLLMVLGTRLEASVEKPLRIIDVELVSAAKPPAPKAPEPKPPPPQPPPVAEPKPEAVPIASPQPPPPSTPPKPARPKGKAKAGKVLAAAPTDTGSSAESIVVGDGGEYAGGETSSSGTSDTAVEGEVEEESLAPEPPPLPPEPPPVVKPKVDAVAATKAYLNTVREELAANQRYPLAARKLNHEGSVVVSFVIDAQGAFSSIKVERSSGSDLLDEAALECVSRLSGKVPRPEATGDLALPLKTSLRYQIADDA
jgi:protein TonB